MISSLSSEIMWRKTLVIIFIFYLFALLQNSFFVYYNLFGAIPNLVIILFFLLLFFQKDDGSNHLIFWAIIAGFFLDIFSSTYIGPSIILLIIVGFLFKNTQRLLKNSQDSYPFAYFISLFVAFLLAFDLVTALYLRFFDPSKFAINFGTAVIFSALYDVLIASILFYVYKKFFYSRVDNRQLKLFRK